MVMMVMAMVMAIYMLSRTNRMVMVLKLGFCGLQNQQKAFHDYNQYDGDDGDGDGDGDGDSDGDSDGDGDLYAK